MNGEILWKAVGEIGEDLVLWAENPPRINRRKNFALILAAALIMLLSVGTAAAMRFNISFADLFGSENAEIIENNQQIIEKSDKNENPLVPPSEEKTGSELTVISVLADERIMYILWQFDYYDGEIPEGARILPDLTFNEAEINNGLGYYGERLDENCDENTLVGYIIAEWNGEMQAESGMVFAYEVTAPEEQGAKIYETDIISAIEQSEYIEGEYKITGDWPYEYYAEYQWLDIPAYEDTYIDLAVYENGHLILVTRTPWGDGVDRRGTYELMNPKTGKVLEHLEWHNFMEKAGFSFNSKIYKVDYEDIPGLYFRRKGEIVQKEWLSGEWKIDFKAEPAMEDTLLKTAKDDISISCSKISMSIKGNIPEMEHIIITLSNGTEAELLSADPERIIFRTPLDPNDIKSIIYNGTELLA